MQLSSLDFSSTKALCVSLAFAIGFASPLTAAQSPAQAGGKISVIYEPGTDNAWNEVADGLKSKPIFDELAKSVNESISFPKDMTARFRNCGQANAFYDPAKQEIVMCYEMIAMVNASFAKTSNDKAEVEQQVMGASIFFFLHELGHALVNQLDLPITGREEDAVDDLASLMILDGDDEGEGQGEGARMLAAAVQQFGEMATKPESLENITFWDEHSLDAQRMYNLLCWIYGSNPGAYAQLVGEDGLPKARAERCPTEFKQRKRSWERLLQGNLKS